MESDSSLSAIALAVSLLVFATAALIEASIASVRRERVQALVSQGVPGSAALERLHLLPMGPTGALSLAKVVSFSASLVSVVALVVALLGARWAALSLTSLALLGFLAVVQMAARSLASVHGEGIAIRLADASRALAWLFNPMLGLQARFAH